MFLGRLSVRVVFYVRHGVSYRDLEEIMYERGVYVELTKLLDQLLSTSCEGPFRNSHVIAG